MENDGNTVFVGVIGTLTSLTLAQINVFLGCLVAIATLVYVGYGIHNRRLRGKLMKAQLKQLTNDEPDDGD